MTDNRALNAKNGQGFTTVGRSGRRATLASTVGRRRTRKRKGVAAAGRVLS